MSNSKYSRCPANEEPVNPNGMIRRDVVSIYKMKDVATCSQRFIRYGEAILGDGTPVQGIIPYGSLVLKFSYNLGKEKVNGFGGLQYHKIYGYPKLDHSGIGLPLKWQVLFKRTLDTDTHEPQTKKCKSLYLNAYALFLSNEIPAALIQYDKENKTDMYQVAYPEFKKWAYLFAGSNKGSNDNDSVVYAQFINVFETLFGLSFYDIQRIRFKDLKHIYTVLMQDGPHKFFEPYNIKNRFKIVDSGTVPVSQTTKPAVSDGLSDEEADYDDSSDSKSKVSEDGIRIELSLKRALSIYESQLGTTGKRNVPCQPDNDNDDDDDDNDDDDTHKNHNTGDDDGIDDFLAPWEKNDDDIPSKTTASYPRSLKGTTSKIDIALPDGTVIISTNSRKVRLAMPSMHKIPEDAWISKLVTTYLKTRYSVNMDMCISKISIMQMIEEGIGMGIPVELTFEKVWSVLKDMTLNGTIAMFDTKTCTIYRKVPTAKDTDMNAGSCTNYEYTSIWDELKSYVDMPDDMYISLPIAMKHEVETFEWLKKHFERRYLYSDHMSRMGEELAKLDTLFNPTGKIARLRLSDEQWQAVCLAVTSPMSLISGPGGTGKTTLIQIIVRILRCAGLKGKFLFTSFKNDTVDQIRKAIKKLDTEEAFEHPVWSAYNRDNDIFATCDSIAYRWGLLGSGDAAQNKPPPPKQSVSPESFASKYKTNIPQQKTPNERPRDPRLDAEVVIVDEASLPSASHFYHLLKAIRPDVVTTIIFIGDECQLHPLKPGIPFCNLIQGIPQLSVRLKKGFRTSSEVITANLDAVRKCDIESMCFHDPTNPEDKDGSCFIYMSDFGSISNNYRSQHKVLQKFGSELEKLLQKRDPNRVRYKDIWAISAYNDVARYASYIYAGYYFGDTVDDTTRLMYAYGKNSIKPNLHVGERVVFIVTDKPKGFACGRVGYITAIFDHKYTTQPPHPNAHAGTRVMDTAAPLHGGMTNRSIVVDGETVVTGKGPASFSTYIEPASCITIHRSQGSEYDEVICLFAPGVNLCDNRVLYTAISRTKEKCHILGTSKQIEKMITTKGRTPMCNFLPLLKGKMPQDALFVFETLSSEFARTTVTMLHPNDQNVFDSEYDGEIFKHLHDNITRRTDAIEHNAKKNLNTQLSSVE